jgi:hypothetical protein
MNRQGSLPPFRFAAIMTQFSLGDEQDLISAKSYSTKG